MLSCANLPKDKEDIIRATILKLKTSYMRSQIVKVYTELSTAQSSSSESRTPAVKVEPLESSALPVMYTSPCEHEYNTPNHVYYGNNYYRGNRGRGRGRARFHKSSPSQQSYNVKKSNAHFKLNPPDETGQPSQCSCCRSMYHWKQQCPVDQQQQRERKGHYSGFHSHSKDDEPI